MAQPKLLIDGQDQGIGGQQVYCRVVPAVNTHGGSNYVVYITIGNVGGAQLTLDGENAQVQQFDFNKIPLNLLFQKNNKTGNSAQATWYGGGTYVITGTASGDDGQSQVTKSFELDVSCP